MSRQITLLLIVVCILLSIASCRGTSSGVELDQEPVTLGLPRAWSTASGDVTQSGYFDWEGPDAMDIRWTREFNPNILPLKAAPNGNFYCYFNYGLAALDPAGNLLWQYDGGRPGNDELVISDDGRLHFIDHDDTVHTVNPDGSVATTLETDIDVRLAYLDSGGRVYHLDHIDGTVDYCLIALDDQGNERWRYNPGVGNDLDVYFQHDRFYIRESSNRLVGMDLDGSQLWTKEYTDARIIRAFATVDGYCLIQRIEGHEMPLEIIDPQGTTLVSENIDRIENEMFGDYSGPDNEFYLQIDDALWCYAPDGSRGQLCSGVDELLGVSPDRYVLFTLADSAATSTVEVLDPELNSRGTLDLDWNIQKWFIGTGGRFYLGDSSLRFCAIACQPGLELDWEYRNNHDLSVITVRENGDATMIDWSGVKCVEDQTPDGIIQRNLTGDLDLLATRIYRGCMADTGCHLLVHGSNCYAVDDEGNLCWEYACDAEILICLPTDDRVWLLSDANCFILDAQGDLLASIENPGGEVLMGIAAGRDGRVYLSDRAGQVMEVNPDGSINWTLNIPDTASTTLVVAGDELLLVKASHVLHGISRDGALRWSYAVDEGYLAKPAYSPKGVIYLPNYEITPVGEPYTGTTDELNDQNEQPESTTTAVHSTSASSGRLLLLTETGGLIKEVDLPVYCRRQPMVDSRGVAYLLDGARGLTAVEPTGRVAWRFDFGELIDYDSYSFVSAPSPTDGFIIASREFIMGIGE